MSEESISHFEWYLYQRGRSHHVSSSSLHSVSVSSMTDASFKWPFLFFVKSVCVSQRLQGNGQNRAVWWKASDRKCHFHLCSAAAQPGPARCIIRQFTFSSPATGKDVNVLTSERVLAWPFLLYFIFLIIYLFFHYFSSVGLIRTDNCLSWFCFLYRCCLMLCFLWKTNKLEVKIHQAKL